MSDTRRIEITHIDEVSCKARGTIQWLLEKNNVKGNATNPITHNSNLEFFIGGEEGFRDIAEQIRAAKESIDLCCWGFDPGMELEREGGKTWPRGATFGDLLIAAAKRKVTVRILVWYDLIGSSSVKSMPGYSYGRMPWNETSGIKMPSVVSAAHSLKTLEEHWAKLGVHNERPVGNYPASKGAIPLHAREEYCKSWYSAAFKGDLKPLSIRTRGGDRSAIIASLKSEKIQPAGLTQFELESRGMKEMGTHHQKPILIDFAFDNGSKAVGYVMGLNSVTDYWDTNAHLLDDPLREQGGKKEREESVQEKELERKGFQYLKPYQDYACRIKGGAALIELHNNFVRAWDDAGGDKYGTTPGACKPERYKCAVPPSLLLRKARFGDSTVQIVRTEPTDEEKCIKDAYFQATNAAVAAAGYMYIENQYFQYEEWAQYLLKKRKEVIDGWSRGCKRAAKTIRDLPVMHVFVVTPVPELKEMIPRTYDALATLGQADGMTGQNKLIKEHNAGRERTIAGPLGRGPVKVTLKPADVVVHANGIDKPSALTLDKQFGMKVAVFMLYTCGVENGKWRYREIYIHSKLMLIDDIFITLGSANLNQRSMAVDTEINISTIDRRLATDLRRRVFSHQTGGPGLDGGTGRGADISNAFSDWKERAVMNKRKILNESEDANYKKLIGFIVTFGDARSSTSRLG